MDKLEQIIESILFLSGDAVQINDIAAKLGVEAREVETAAKALKQKYSGSSGVHMLMFNKKLQLSSNPDYAASVEAVLNPIKERELSKTMMEVAAIVAYKQPVTRLEIEEIRGVNSDYALLTLSKHNIIEVVGRKDAIGKPLLYGTTDEFLKRFQLSSLNDLPDYDQLISRIKILHSDTTDLYYREQYNPDDEQQNLISSVAEEADLLHGLKELEAQTDTAAKALGIGKTAAQSAVLEAAATEQGDSAAQDAAIDGEEINDNTLSSGGMQPDAADNAEQSGTTWDNKSADSKRGGVQSASDGHNGQADSFSDDSYEELPDFLRDEKDVKVIK